MRLVLTRQFGTAFAVMLAVGAILFGSTQILPQMMQEAYGYTAYLSGLALMPGGLAMLVMMPLAGQIANHIQAKYLIAAGMFIIVLAMWHMTGLDGHVTFGWSGLGAHLPDDRTAVPVHPDQHGGLCRPAAEQDQPSVVADQRVAQSRRQLRDFACQYGTRASRAVPPFLRLAERVHPVLASVPPYPSNR